MRFSILPPGCEQDLIQLFTATFTASEGVDEGTLIGDLVRRLLTDTPANDLHVFAAEDAGGLVGGCIFSRLTYPEDVRTVFILAPVAVASERQGQGIGQQLLCHALGVLREAGVAIVVTYGDPGFYAKVGFQPVSEADAAAPFRLKYPHGWQGQSLTGTDWRPLQGDSRCVSALNDPVFW